MIHDIMNDSPLVRQWTSTASDENVVIYSKRQLYVDMADNEILVIHYQTLYNMMCEGISHQLGSQRAHFLVY
jgi:hypothetical protein